MSPIALYAALTGEPFLLTMAEIAELTDWQIERVYGHPRDKKTGIVEEQPEAPKRMTMAQKRAQFISMGVALGKRREHLEKAWDEKYGN